MSQGRIMQDRQARRARWAVAAMFLANGFVMGAWAPQIPLLMPRHGVTESVLGLLILVLGLGAVSAMLFAGRLISLYGGRKVLSLFALALIPVLLGATWVHSGNGWVFSSEGGGWEFPLFWAAIQGAIALLGSGAYALKPSSAAAVAA